MRSDEEALVPQVAAQRALRSRTRWLSQGFRLVVGLVAAVLAAALLLLGKTRFQEDIGDAALRSSGAVPDTGLWTGPRLCSPRFHLTELMHSNLAGLGPDDGEESLVFRLRGDNGTKVDMVIQALNQDFQVWKPRKIGIKDGLAVVWTSGLSRLLTKVSFRSATTKQEITLPQLAFSVYDLHKKHKTHSQQAVKVLDVAGNWTDVIRSNHSLVAVQQDMLAGSITLNGTDRGRLEPLEDLAHLSHDHVRRVVTVRFSNLKSFNLEFRSGERDGHESFQFAPEAAMLCAVSMDGLHPAARFIPNHRLQERLPKAHEDEAALRAGESAFHGWLVSLGDVVSEGDPLYSVSNSSGDIYQVRSEVYGQVVEIFPDLMPGDVLEPELTLMILKIRKRLPWPLLLGICGGFGCVAVVAAAFCFRSSPNEPPPPLILGENDVVVLEFRTPIGWIQTAIWKYQPLGLGFHKSLPAIVAYVSDEAKHAGVMEGDELVKIGTEQHGMRPILNRSYEEFWKQLCDLVAQLPDAPRLMLEFETKHGRQRQIEWTTKPLGVSFDRAMPMKVTEVHEEALHLNIRIGDTLTRYGLESNILHNTEGKTFEEVFNVISSHMATFPVATRMICVFELPDQTLREFMWHARPLGLSFGEGPPLVVTKVQTPADRKGVKEGYILRRFGNDYRMLEATDSHTMARTLADMKKFENMLPDATAQAVDAW